MKLRLLVLLLSVLSVAAPAGVVENIRQNPEVASNIGLLRTWIRAQMDARGIPGLAIAVVHDRDIIWAEGFGYANLQQRTPVTPQTIFRIASITKTFTSTAIMMLRDRGKLHLDDPVAQHLPWFSYRNRFPDAPPITIRQVMTHTSGLPREAAFPYWTDYRFPSREEMIAAFQQQESVFEPATRLKYSNLAMAILGEVVAAAAGVPYGEFVTREILRPLGMSSTSVVPPPDQLSRFATGYGRRFPDGHRDVSPMMDARALTPAANMSSTVEDMARYAMFHLQEERPATPLILSPATLREMHRVHWVGTNWKSGYGLGFDVSKSDERVIFGHGGWVAGNRSRLSISSAEKFAVVVMVNADDGVPGLFANRAVSMLAPAIARVAAPATPPVPFDSAWVAYTGIYTDPSGWDAEILIRKGKLFLYNYNYPPEEDPLGSLVELTPEGKHLFRMTGDGASGELVRFEMGPDGKVMRVKAEENYLSPKR